MKKKIGKKHKTELVKHLDKNYTSTETPFDEVVQLIHKAREKAFSAVNTALVDLYWQVGEYISHKLESAEWGEGVVEKLAAHISKNHPELKGFNRPNLFRMRQFYLVYQGDIKVSTLLRQLTWSHNLLIISKCKIREEREFYLHLAVKEGYSFRQLERQIDSCLFERAVTSPAKVSSLMSQLYPPALEVFKDSYILDFLNLPELHSEEDLQRGLVGNLRKFLLELGRDFCFVGEEYKLQVGGKDFFIDLLFFHRGLSCLVAFELKIDDFKPEYLGKLAFYLKALDKNIKKGNENPSVGVLLCKSKDSEIVEFSLSSSLAPALIAEYQTKLPDKKLLESKLHEFYELNKLEGDSL